MLLNIDNKYIPDIKFFIEWVICKEYNWILQILNKISKTGIYYIIT